MAPTSLPLPRLSLQERQSIMFLTDNALAEEIGVRVAFSGRGGGVSEGAYASLNLGDHVGDHLRAVQANRQRLLAALDAPDMPLVVPRQVHGSTLVSVASCDPRSLEVARDRAQAGADGVVVAAPNVAALLCFADCVPVIAVSPSGRFAVVHAGWRGVEAGVAPQAVRALAREDQAAGTPTNPLSYNVYVGPHIRGECFQTGADVHALFVSRFGEGCAHDSSHISLVAALKASLVREGVDAARICDAGVCTMCSCTEYFSYRASGGLCGRHGAVAFRRER